MPRLHALPLRARLVAIVLALLTIALVLLTVTTAYLTRRDLLDRMDTELRAVAAPVATQALDDLAATGGRGVPTGYAFALMTVDGAAVHVVNPTGETQHPDLPPIPITDERVSSGLPFAVSSRDGKLQWRFVAGRVGNQGTFVVGLPLRSVENTVGRLLLTSGVFSAVVLALCGLIGWYAVTRAFRPLREIEDTAAQIAKGDLTRRVPESAAEDEVASLGASLNVMLARIEESFAIRAASQERMRQFVSDASHELRTPLATVRGYAELHRQGALTDPPAATAAFARIESEAVRMGGLVDDLLTLARLDEEPVTERREVDLTVIAADAVADARARAPERSIRLTGLSGVAGGLGPAVTWGTEARLRQVVTNIVANALAHTPAGTPVEVKVGLRDGDLAGASGPLSSDNVVVEVADHGPGIPADQRQHVFERFVRADHSRESRARTDGGGGSGLGLAIVAAIVGQHGGRVGIAETPGGGTTVVVLLPAAAERATPTGDSQPTPMER